MFKFSHIKRFCVTGTVAVALLCTPAALVPITAATAAETTETLVHGAWRGILRPGGGYLISSTLADGGMVALFVNGQSLSLIMAGPGWKMTVGDKFPVRIQIDGAAFFKHDTAVFSEEAVVANAGAIAIQNMPNAVLVKLALGDKLTLNIGSNGLVWAVDLDGFSAALVATTHAYAPPA